MTVTLAFDTSMQPLTVTVARDQTVLAQVVTNEAKNHSVQLLPAIQQVIKEANLTYDDLDVVAVAQGPGSFTGLRIGVTVAKTLANQLPKVKLVGLSSLAILAQEVRQNRVIVPMFNARNNNVFAGIYQKKDDQLSRLVTDEHQSLDQLLKRVAKFDQGAIFVGDAVDFTDEIQKTFGENAQIQSAIPSGIAILELAKQTPATSNIDDFNPNYLRKTQAELNWLADHPDAKKDNYVQTVGTPPTT